MNTLGTPQEHAVKHALATLHTDDLTTLKRTLTSEVYASFTLVFNVVYRTIQAGDDVKTTLEVQKNYKTSTKVAITLGKIADADASVFDTKHESRNTPEMVVMVNVTTLAEWTQEVLNFL